MSDPVAEAAAQLATQQSDPSLLEKAMDTIHDLEAKVEHLIHPHAEPIPNAVDTPPAGDATDAAGDLPNAASAAGEPTAEQDSAPSADGASTESQIGASSGELLHARVAEHLEAIYTMVRDHALGAQGGIDTSALKTHVGDILHRISNGMAVTEGELVQKLEALYRML